MKKLVLPPWPASLRACARELRRWGWPGALGAAMLAVALGFALVAVPRGTRQLVELEDAVQTARLAASRAQRRQAAAHDEVDPLLRFMAVFPQADQRNERIARLLAGAAAAGLEPRRSEFRALPEASLGLVRQRVLLPLEGRYEAVRQFVEQALREDSALSLDSLRIERADAQAALCRVELQFSLWMRVGDRAVRPPAIGIADAAMSARENR